MSDIRSYTREKQKQQLKQKVITNKTVISEDSEEVIEEVHKKRLKRKLITIGVLAALVAAVIFAFTRYQYYFQYTEYESTWSVEIKEGSFSGYATFSDNIIKYSKDGASYYDSKGKSIWSIPYELKSPIIAVNEGFAAIADMQGNLIYICDKTGSVGTVTTALPISKVSVSAHGVVAAILEDSTTNYITCYGKDGTKLYDIKTLLSANGYPLDTSISPNGTQLISSFMYYSSSLQNQVVFHNYSEVGKKNVDRLVGAFKDFGSAIIPKVSFLNDTYACAFGDNFLGFYSLRNVLEPEPKNRYTFEEDIKSIFYSKDYVGIMLINNGGEYPYRLEVYTAGGDEVLSKPIDFEYTQAEFSGDMILLYNEEACHMYNMSGVQKFAGTFDFTISKVVRGSLPNSLIITGVQKMEEIRLK